MEREILIANTKTQKRNSFKTSATTLGELKNDLTAHDIDYSGMDFTEGISHTLLIDDNSTLPNNTRKVKDKEGKEYSLVFLLSYTKKNIPLGAIPAERAELFNFIKAHNLQADVVAEFGKNMTQVRTESLKRFVVSHNTEAATSSTPITPTTPSSTPTTPSTPSTPETDEITLDDILAQHGFTNEPEYPQEENTEEEPSKEAKYIRRVDIYGNEFITIITDLVQHLYDCGDISSDDLDELVNNLTEVDK